MVLTLPTVGETLPFLLAKLAYNTPCPFAYWKIFYTMNTIIILDNRCGYLVVNVIFM